MLKWLGFHRPARRGIGRPATPAPVAAPAAAPVAAAAAPAASEAPTPDLLAWLLDAPAAGPAGEAEHAAVRLLQALAAQSQLPPKLLSRAPAVIPQLLRLMRRDDASLPEMARRIAADPVLSAEVLRRSRGLWHAGDGDAEAPAMDLTHAIALLGAAGLQRAIAAALARPLFDAPAASLCGRASARLWQHSALKAERCAALAAERGLDAFEGYLAGLLHNTGWTVALRAIDLSLQTLPPFSAGFCAVMAPLAEPLFAKAARGWHVSPALDALCEEILRGADAAASPLRAALRAGDRAATVQLAGAAA